MSGRKEILVIRLGDHFLGPLYGQNSRALHALVQSPQAAHHWTSTYAATKCAQHIKNTEPEFRNTPVAVERYAMLDGGAGGFEKLGDNSNPNAGPNSLH